MMVTEEQTKVTEMMRSAGTPMASMSALGENSPSSCLGSSRKTAVPISEMNGGDGEHGAQHLPDALAVPAAVVVADDGNGGLAQAHHGHEQKGSAIYSRRRKKATAVEEKGISIPLNAETMILPRAWVTAVGRPTL